MGKEGWFTVYFMVTSRLKDSSIYQGFTTSTLKCPTVNIFFFIPKQSWKIILKSWIFHVHSSSSPGQIYIFQIFIIIFASLYSRFSLSAFSFNANVRRLYAIAWKLFEQRNESSSTDIRHEEEEDDEEDEEEDEEVRWCHPTKQVRVCQYRSILSIVWWGEIILIIDVFWDGESRR